MWKMSVSFIGVRTDRSRVIPSKIFSHFIPPTSLQFLPVVRGGAGDGAAPCILAQHSRPLGLTQLDCYTML